MKPGKLKLLLCNSFLGCLLWFRSRSGAGLGGRAWLRSSCGRRTLLVDAFASAQGARVVSCGQPLRVLLVCNDQSNVDGTYLVDALPMEEMIAPGELPHFFFWLVVAKTNKTTFTRRYLQPVVSMKRFGKQRASRFLDDVYSWS